MDQVKQMKVVNCGVLQDHPKGNFRHICEFKLVKAGPLSESFKKKLKQYTKQKKIKMETSSSSSDSNSTISSKSESDESSTIEKASKSESFHFI
jgi:hypothetical protein